MRVYAPNKTYSGRIGKDVFVNGVCENAVDSQLWYYRALGYQVEGFSGEQTPENTTGKLTPPPEHGSTQEWKNFLTAVGVDYPEKPKRAELIELWRQFNGAVSTESQ